LSEFAARRDSTQTRQRLHKPSSALRTIPFRGGAQGR